MTVISRNKVLGIPKFGTPKIGFAKFVQSSDSGKYHVTVKYLDEGVVTISPRKSGYSYGDVVNISFEPDAVHEFVSWNYVDSNDNITDRVYSKTPATSYKVDGTICLCPICVEKPWTGTFRKESNTGKDGTALGKVTGPDTFTSEMVKSGKTLSFYAEPIVEGQSLGRWVDSNNETIGTGNPLVLDMSNIDTTGYTVKGMFNKWMTGSVFYVTVPDLQGSGTVDGIDGKGWYLGDTCTVTATASKGFFFAGWTDGSGNITSTDATISFDVYGDTTIYPLFESCKYNTVVVPLTGDGVVAGTVTGTGTYGIGDNIDILSQPYEGFALKEVVYRYEDEGRMFDELLDDKINTRVSFENIFKMAGGMGTIVSIFRRLDATRSVSYSISEYGNVKESEFYYSTDGGDTWGSLKDGGFSVNEGDDVMVKIESDSVVCTGWRWFPDGPIVDTPILRTKAVGNLELIPVVYDKDITITTDIIGSGKVSGSGEYTYGQIVTLDVQVFEGYLFHHWEIDGKVASTDKTYVFKAKESETVTAVLKEENRSQVIVIVHPFLSGTIDGAGYYSPGQTCTLVATPSEGYEFVEWTDGNKPISDNPYTFVVLNGDRAFTANFSGGTSGKKTITVTTDPPDSGTVTGGGEYDDGDTCTVRASTGGKKSLSFVDWEEEGNVVSTDSEYTFTVDSDRDLVAHFGE